MAHCIQTILIVRVWTAWELIGLLYDDMEKQSKIVRLFVRYGIYISIGGMVSMEELERKLKENLRYPFHMPGHKRNVKKLGHAFPYDLDITEITDFDNLLHASGILQELMHRAARLFGAKNSFLMVNGSSGGLLAGIRAATKPGDTVLMARGCHRSVYHAIELCNLKPIYVTAPVLQENQMLGSIQPEAVKQALQAHPECTLVIVTSPTYEGVVSDIAAIAEYVHRANAVLLVDEAHGAHMGFSDAFPSSGVALGADVVVQSLHKTLPSPTQTAILHLCSERVSVTEIRRQLSIFQTSSPSYVLMAAMERCIKLLEEEKESLFSAYVSRLMAFYDRTSSLKKLSVLHPQQHVSVFAHDIGKLLISTQNSNMTGPQLADVLRHTYKLEIEMAQPSYVLAMSSILDTDAAFIRLADALYEIDASINRKTKTDAYVSFPLPPAVSTIAQALASPTAEVALEQSENGIAADYIFAYPPGIPLIVPGERITRALLEQIAFFKQIGIHMENAYAKEGAVQIMQAEHQK